MSESPDLSIVDQGKNDGNEKTSSKKKTAKKSNKKKSTKKKTSIKPKTARSDDSAHLARILDQTAVVAKWQLHVDNAKATAKETATKLKLEQQRLHQVITGQEQTYLELESNDDTPVNERLIAGLGLPADVERILVEAGHETIGDMVDFVDKGGRFCNIEGIGEQLDGRIAESLGAYVQTQSS